MKTTFQVILVSLLLALGSKSGWADDNAQLKAQVQALQQQVNQLEALLEGRQQAASMPGEDQYADPLNQMMLMQRQMDRNMRRAFAGTETFAPRTDMNRTDKQYIVTMDIPGMDKDKISVQIKNNMLIISGERRSEKGNNTQDPKDQYYRQERFFGTFMQAVPLPEDALKDKVQANYTNGVLTVRVDRAAQGRPNEQKIRVN